MPLIEEKSAKSMSKNIKTEMAAGKPQKQAVAIAYSEKAKAEGKKKMSKGGVAPSSARPFTKMMMNHAKHAEGSPVEGCYACGTRTGVK